MQTNRLPWYQTTIIVLVSAVLIAAFWASWHFYTGSVPLVRGTEEVLGVTVPVSRYTDVVIGPLLIGGMFLLYATAHGTQDKFVMRGSMIVGSVMGILILSSSGTDSSTGIPGVIVFLALMTLLMAAVLVWKNGLLYVVLLVAIMAVIIGLLYALGYLAENVLKIPESLTYFGLTAFALGMLQDKTMNQSHQAFNCLALLAAAFTVSIFIGALVPAIAALDVALFYLLGFAGRRAGDRLYKKLKSAPVAA